MLMGLCEERMHPKQHTVHTQACGDFKKKKKFFWTITYKLILKYGTLKSKKTGINMCGEC